MGVNGLFVFLHGEHLLPVLAHSLWEGLLISLLLLALLRAISVKGPELRYGLCCGALACLICLMGGTFALLEYRATLSSPGTPTATLAEDQSNGASPRTVSRQSLLKPGDRATHFPRSVRPTPWTQVVAMLWLFGVAFMLLRMARMQWTSARVPRHATAVTDAGVRDLVDTLADQLGVKRTIRVLVTPALQSPAVLGFFAPVILLPLAALSGLSEPLLRAAIAHELAHIRRHDYLINQIQLLVEAFLFFNPAVWWISHQIRAEREACCDALAARAVGGALDYAKSLAAWTALANRPPSPALAMDGPTRGSARERIHRLLDSGYVPALSRSWLGAAALCAGSLAILAALGGGSFLATFALARALTPAERLAELEAVAEAYLPETRDGEEEPDVLLRVLVKTADDSPLPEDLNVWVHVEPTPSSTYAWDLRKEALDNENSVNGPSARYYSNTVTAGPTQITATATGYVPAFQGPIRTGEGYDTGDIVLELDRGFTTYLQLAVDGSAPVAEVSVEGRYEGPFSQKAHSLVSDSSGRVTITHAGQAPITWTVSAPGYEWEQRTFTHEPDGTVRWELTPGLPTSGTVLNDVDGTPLSDVTLYVMERTGGPHPMNFGPEDTDLLDALGTTDGAGRFTLTTLRQDTQYTLMAVAGSGSRAFFPKVRAGDTGLHFSMPAELYVRGTVRGALERLPQRQGRPELHFFKTRKTFDSSHSFGTRTYLDVTDGVGTFELTDLWPGTLEFEFPGGRETLEVTQSVDDFFIEIPPEAKPGGPPAEREVIIRFNGTEDAPAAGSIRVNHRSKPESRALDLYGPYPVVDGEIRLTIPVPNTVGPHPNGLLGYWFQRQQVEVPLGDEAFVLALDTVPAGSIHGTLTKEDGAPEGKILLSLAVVEEPELPADVIPDLGIVVADSESGGARTFMATPLPLGGTYRILAWHSPTYVVSPEFKLDERHPVKSVDLVVPKGKPLQGKVLAEDGSPLRGIEVKLEFQLPNRGGSYGGRGAITTQYGIFSFDGVNPNVDGAYSLVIRSMGTHCGLWVKDVAITDDVPEYRLSPGINVTGTVYDPDGKPAGEVKVTALPDAEENPGVPLEECATAPDGSFTFPNLGSGAYRFIVTGSGLDWMVHSDFFDTRKTQHIELRAK